jgi:hypothetical protein
VLRSAKPTVRGGLPDAGDAEKSVKGVFETLETTIYPNFVNELVPYALLAIKVTEYSPVLLNVCSGFCPVEEVPSPKVHFQESGDPVL